MRRLKRPGRRTIERIMISDESGDERNIRRDNFISARLGQDHRTENSKTCHHFLQLTWSNRAEKWAELEHQDGSEEIRQTPCCHFYEPDGALARPFKKSHPLDVKMQLGTVYLWAGFLPKSFGKNQMLLKSHQPSHVTHRISNHWLPKSAHHLCVIPAMFT